MDIAGAVRSAARNREKTLTLNYTEVDCARRGACAFHGSGCRIIKTIKVPAINHTVLIYLRLDIRSAI